MSYSVIWCKKLLGHIQLNKALMLLNWCRNVAKGVLLTRHWPFTSWRSRKKVIRLPFITTLYIYMFLLTFLPYHSWKMLSCWEGNVKIIPFLISPLFPNGRLIVCRRDTIHNCCFEIPLKVPSSLLTLVSPAIFHSALHCIGDYKFHARLCSLS